MASEYERISPDEAGTLAGLFRVRVERSPDEPAYRQFDISRRVWMQTSWAGMAAEVARWQSALQKEGLEPGDRVGIMLRNCREWVVFDQAALGLGLVTVPLFVEDRPDNVVYIARDSGIKLLLVEGKKQWQRLQSVGDNLDHVQRIVSLNTIEEEDEPRDPRLVSLNDWIFGLSGQLQALDSDPHALASIVYTSGTTGRPKGVMLSHYNMLYNAAASASCAPFGAGDVFLSFLPLSHTLERTAGYYLAMMAGAEVAYARSIPQLAEDLVTVKPTILISVPRIYERVYSKIQAGLNDKSAIARGLFNLAVDVGYHRFEHRQGRAGWHPKLLLWPLLERLVAGKVMEKLGGNIRFAVSGGAALAPPIARVFIGLGLDLLQGYGMTEASPVVSANRPDANEPASIGLPLDGIEVRIGEHDELLTRSPSVMLGYWNNDQATGEAIDEDGWLHTGDKARIDEHGHIFITGRLKEIIVLANGEKVPPADMEMAIALDPLFEQVMVIGEAKPFLAALVVLNEEQWRGFAEQLGVDPDDPSQLQAKAVERAAMERIGARLHEFPGYAQIRRVRLGIEPWTVDMGLLTPTMKLKRAKILERFSDDIAAIYEGHVF